MADKVKIGFVCGKGHGHTQFVGEIDYGACGSKTVAEIFVTVEEREDLYPEYRGLMTAEDVAGELREIVNEHDNWREKRMWDD